MRRRTTTEKKAKRLEMRRETLRTLEPDQLHQIAGGGVEPSPFVPPPLIPIPDLRISISF